MRPGLYKLSRQLVEKEINRGNPTVPGDDEISSSVSWRLTRAARYPSEPPAVAQFLGCCNWLILKVRVSRPDRARDAIDFVSPTMGASFGIVKDSIFSPDLVDGRASTRGIVFTKDLQEVAGQ